MQTNKIPIPDFIDAKATGAVNVSLQFEQGATINYNIYAKENEVINTAKFTRGVDRFTALGYVFKLQNSTLTVDPLSGKQTLSASFSAIQFALLFTSKSDEPDVNPFEVRTIGNASRTILADNVIKLEVNYGADDSRDWDFTTSYLTWGSEDEEYDTNDDGNAYTNLPIYEQVQYPESVVINDPENAAIPPYTGLIKDFSMNYDVSGETKTRETNYYEGSILKRKVVQTYGYTYYSDEVSELVDINGSLDPQMSGVQLSQYWGLVEYFTINYNYQDGYYLGYDKTGAKKCRYSLEEDYDILRLLEEENPPDTISAQAFRFFWVPIVEYEKLELHAYYRYYRDAQVTFDDQYFWVQGWSRELNKWIWTKVKKLDYVLPMFVKKQITYSRCFAHTYVGKTHALNFEQATGKILTTGQENKVITEININPSDSTEMRQYYGGNGVEDSYEVLTETVTVQDDGFKNFTKQTRSESNFGRPGQADYYPSFRQVEREQDLNQDQPRSPRQYYVRKYNTSINDTPQSTINIPDGRSVKDAFIKLQKQIRKQLLFNGDQFTVTCLYDPTIKPNNILSVSYKGRSYRGIVKSVDHNFEILGRNVGKGYTTVTVGIENQKNNMWRDIRLSDMTQNNNTDDNNPNPPPVGQPRPSILGGVDDIATLVENLPGRGNLR